MNIVVNIKKTKKNFVVFHLHGFYRIMMKINLSSQVFLSYIDFPFYI